MKKFWSKIVSVFMMFAMAFLMVACNTPGANTPDNYNKVIGMTGTKVLYRPDNYDFDKGSGAGDGETNDYYGQFAWQILNAMFNTYGVWADNTLATYDIKNADEYIYYYYYTDNIESQKQKDSIVESDYFYLYDSIRYQVSKMGQTWKYNDKDGNIQTNEGSYIETKNNAWNWKLPQNIAGDEPYFYGYNIYDKENDWEIEFKPYYRDIYSNLYSSYLGEYLNTTQFPDAPIPQMQYDNYSEYVQALEYVIYSYALDLEPAHITVQVKQDSPYYHLGITGYNDDVSDDGITKTAIAKALEDRKRLFSQVGSFVGLLERQQTKVANWIKENVIGKNAKDNESFTVYDTVTENRVYDVDPDTHETLDTYTVTGYDFSGATTTYHRYYDSTVDNIVDKVCSYVSIGGSEEEGVPIDDNFLASEITEYAGDTFVINSDTNFADPTENLASTYPYIQAREYQSAVLMFPKRVKITDLLIAVKYDCYNSGKKVGDPYGDNYLEIKLELNFYSNSTNELLTVSSDIFKVYDGPYDVEYLSSPSKGDQGAPAGHQSGIWFKEVGKLFGYSQAGLRVGAFNTEIGGGALKTDIGQNGYQVQDNIYVSQSPLVLTGLTNSRKYYKLLQDKQAQEGIDSEHSYITGRLDETMFAGSDGCDYLEIVYKVIKKNGDYATNYRFYTGIQFADVEEATESNGGLYNI